MTSKAAREFVKWLRCENDPEHRFDPILDRAMGEETHVQFDAALADERGAVDRLIRVARNMAAVYGPEYPDKDINDAIAAIYKCRE